MNDDLQRAIALHQSGNIADAEHAYRSVLSQNPDEPDALALLGVINTAQKNFPEALLLMQQAIKLDPTAPLFHFYLANIFAEIGDDTPALAAYQKALELKPDFAEAQYRVGLIFETCHRYAEAIPHLKRATELAPAQVEAWLALSDVAQKNRDYTTACTAARQAVELQPTNVAAHIALGLAYDFLNNEDEAAICFQHATELKPDFIEAWDMLGMSFQNLNRLDEAEVIMHRTLSMAGGIVATEASRDVDEQAYIAQHWNLALLELLRGNYHFGWAHYRARFKDPHRPQRLPIPRTLWCGQPLSGKKILVVGDQGFGDVLMLCRFGALLKTQGAHVTLLVHPALVSLLQKSKLVDAVLCEAPQNSDAFNFQTSIFDLPYQFDTRLETIPAIIPYLPVPDADAATRLFNDSRPRIGVVWAGRHDHGNDRRRSIPLSTFAGLFTESHAHFFNLTRDITAEDFARLAQHKVTNLAPQLDDFLTTARFIAQMDLIITCDTAVAHLAGGMGKETWVLLPFAPEWRWLMKRQDSPWYPTARLFRQPQRADWGSVIHNVRQELSKRFPA
jgi:tetratricopeptide (TPR) repeat protein/ADP-heptose:LPS heptosyltransferase